jgi:2-methylcitrate dehydratase
VTGVTFSDLSAETVRCLEIRILDSLGVAIGALDAEPIRAIREHVDEFGGNPLATLIGGGATAPDRAAFYNGALVRYLDFMDSYMAPGETFHPSDNLGAVMAAAEYAGAGGRDLITAMAVAYEVQARLSEAAPVRAKGFDHTTQGAYAAAAGVSRALGLDARQTANAIAISGTANNALRVTRTGALSHWKGLAYPNTAFSATHCAFLARRGITGPADVFEGNKGFKHSIAGPFRVDWETKSFDGVFRSVIKKYDAEIHSQSALEGALELRERHGFKGTDVRSVEIDIFQVAYDIIGGGEEGDKTDIRTKEEAACSTWSPWRCSTASSIPTSTARNGSGPPTCRSSFARSR